MSGITRKGSGRPSYYYRLLGRTRLQRQRSRSRSRTRPANKGKGASDAFIMLYYNFLFVKNCDMRFLMFESCLFKFTGSYHSETGTGA